MTYDRDSAVEFARKELVGVTEDSPVFLAMVDALLHPEATEQVTAEQAVDNTTAAIFTRTYPLSTDTVGYQTTGA